MKNTDKVHNIRVMRQCYNDAILIRNVDKICSFFTSDYHVITGRGVQSYGKSEQHQRWTTVFQKDPMVVYRRHTRELRISEQLECAEELGNWVGKYSLDKAIILVAGVYSAKWQRQENKLWLIQSEVFTTLRSKRCNV